jgi:hypothetical protein
MVNMLMNNMWIVKVGRMIIIDETYLIWVKPTFQFAHDLQGSPDWGTLAQCIAYSSHEEKGKSCSRDMNTFMIDDNTQAVGMQQHLANELPPASSSS